MAPLISVIMATQLNIAPLIIPLLINGTVILTSVFNFDAPKLLATSSIDRGICINLAVADRIVYGILLMTKFKIMTQIVPVNAQGFGPKANTSAIPMTDPGMMYGSMLIVSRVLLISPPFLTTRKAIKIEMTIIIASEMNP